MSVYARPVGIRVRSGRRVLWPALWVSKSQGISRSRMARAFCSAEKLASSARAMSSSSGRLRKPTGGACSTVNATVDGSAPMNSGHGPTRSPSTTVKCTLMWCPVMPQPHGSRPPGSPKTATQNCSGSRTTKMTSSLRFSNSRRMRSSWRVWCTCWVARSSSEAAIRSKTHFCCSSFMWSRRTPTRGRISPGSQSQMKRSSPNCRCSCPSCLAFSALQAGRARPQPSCGPSAARAPPPARQ